MELLCGRTRVRIEWHESGWLTTGIIWEGQNGCLYVLQYCCYTYSYNLHSAYTVMSLDSIGCWGPSGVHIIVILLLNKLATIY